MPEIQETVSGGTRTRYSTKETAQLIRLALKQTFPGVKFSVTTAYASMTSATSIKWTDGPTEPEVELVTNRFTSRGFDGMTDSSTYHEQIVDGQRVSYSGWVTTRRDLSASLLQRALDRYNVVRQQYGFGPAALEVTTGAYPDLIGDDMSRENPCGGRATWCSQAVQDIAHHLRPNGCLVTVKGRR